MLQQLQQLHCKDTCQSEQTPPDHALLLFVVIIENIAGTEEEEEDLASISANSK